MADFFTLNDIAQTVLEDERMLRELNAAADDSIQVIDGEIAVDVTAIVPIIAASTLRALAEAGFIQLDDQSVDDTAEEATDAERSTDGVDSEVG